MTIEERAIVGFLESPAPDYQVTWREWIRAVLVAFGHEGEGFSGKRPLGNSGWENELADSLCEAGLLEFKVHENEDDELEYSFSWNDVNAAWSMVVDHLVR